MNKSNENIIIKDPLYKQILVEKRFKKIIDLPEFQRLRNIKQTAFVDFVYPNANHARFSHSIGAYHLMCKVLNNGHFDNLNSKTKFDLKLSALVHDIGHGPFSHSWEKIFPNFNHENATYEILKKFKLFDVIDILKKNSPYSHLITSTIDIDKLDYMARDSHFSGVSYGISEVDFIIQHLYIKENKLVIKKSAISSVEDLITQRINLFKTVYYHKFSVEYDFLFTKIFQRVRDLLEEKKQIDVNKNIKSFFDNNFTINNLLKLNDAIVLNQIYEWLEYEDKILKDLCFRFINRIKFKVVNLEYTKVDIEKLKKKISKKYDLRYYFKKIYLPIQILQTPIYIEINNKLMKLEKISPLIKFYKTQKLFVEFLIYPKD